MKKTLVGLFLMAFFWIMGLHVEAAGFSHVMQLGSNGVAQVAFGGRNIWKPLSIALLFGDGAERTVTISRHVEGLSYQIASLTRSGQAYLYLFEGVFWFSGTNMLQIVVDPPTAGIVEVIGE